MLCKGSVSAAVVRLRKRRCSLAEQDSPGSQLTVVKGDTWQAKMLARRARQSRVPADSAQRGSLKSALGIAIHWGLKVPESRFVNVHLRGLKVP